MVLFALSWRLGPILAGVIVATAVTANVYKQQTKAVEAENAAATSEMNNIASQAFESITTVRWGGGVPLGFLGSVSDKMSEDNEWEGGGGESNKRCGASVALAWTICASSFLVTALYLVRGPSNPMAILIKIAYVG